MAFNVTRTGSLYEREVLKYSVGAEILSSYVLDSTRATVTADSAGRYVWPAGTPMKLSGGSDRTVVPYDGAGDIVGIAAKYIEMAANGATSSDTPLGVYSHNAVFATTEVVGFTAYASALISSLPTCSWE